MRALRADTVSTTGALRGPPRARPSRGWQAASAGAMAVGLGWAVSRCISSACTAGETSCAPDGGATYCASTQTDTANCGACGVACTPGQLCTSGQCLTCGSLTACALEGGVPYCANTETDNANCGGCGALCDAGQTCSGGQCATTCVMPMVVCSGTCASVETDPDNCGDCGNVCGTANATAFCSAGVCALACQTGFADCDGVNGNGCEVQTSTDVANCGGCGTACDASEHAVCASGQCVGWLSHQPWTEASSNANAALGDQAALGASDGETFTYSAATTDGSGAEQSFTFQAVATSSFALALEWQYAGNNGGDESTASFQAFADGPVGTTTVTLVASQSVSGDSSRSPATSPSAARRH
ncbi:MAG: hypothetical protein ABTD50_13905 [Polyangiaceae bacterium]